eukprot:PhF_6_TR35413/c0_g1_i1/m.51543
MIDELQPRTRPPSSRPLSAYVHVRPKYDNDTKKRVTTRCSSATPSSDHPSSSLIETTLVDPQSQSENNSNLAGYVTIPTNEIMELTFPPGTMQSIVYVVLSGNIVVERYHHDAPMEEVFVPMRSSISLSSPSLEGDDTICRYTIRCAANDHQAANDTTDEDSNMVCLFFTKFTMLAGGAAPPSPFDTPRQITIRKNQRAYVNRIRHAFAEAERNALRLIDYPKEKEKLLAAYTHSAGELNASQWTEEYEPLMRTCVVEEESMWFEEIKRKRFRDRLIPWCTLSCSYCCQTKDEWETQARAIFDQQQSSVGAIYLSFHEDYFSIFEESRHLIDVMRSMHTQLIQLNKKALLECEEIERRERALLFDHETYDRIVMKQQVDVYSLACHHKLHTINLAEREYNVHRTWIDVTLRETKIQKRQLEFVELDETCSRQRLCTQEDALRTTFKSKMGSLLVRTQFKEQEEQFSSTTAERDALRKEVQREEKRRIDEAREAAEKLQSELMEEFNLLKKIKKGKVELPPPPCPRCGGVVSGDLLQHRSTDCPKRPVECKLCKGVYYATELETHVTLSCTHRPLQCERCSVYYKAAYHPDHSNECANIQRARDVIAQCVPVVPFTLLDKTRDNGTVIGEVTAGSEMERRGLVAGDALLALNQVPTPSKKDVEAFLGKVAVGDNVTITLMSEEGTQFGSVWVVQTTVPLEVYRQCVSTVTNDTQQQTKAPPKKKAAGSPTKKK